MRQMFIADEEFKNDCGRINIDELLDLAPFASVIIKVEGGYRAIESYSDLIDVPDDDIIWRWGQDSAQR